MKLKITMSGGFAGIENQQVLDVDTELLDVATANEIERRVELLLDEQKPVIGSDLIRYTIDVDKGNESHEIVDIFDEANPESDLQKLLSIIQ